MSYEQIIGIALVITIAAIVIGNTLKADGTLPAVKLWPRVKVFSQTVARFQSKKLKRAFIVLQCAGFLGFVFLCVNADQWHPFPRLDYNNDLVWDLFNGSHWAYYHENWWALALLLGPFMTTRSIDWITEIK